MDSGLVFVCEDGKADTRIRSHADIPAPHQNPFFPDMVHIGDSTLGGKPLQLVRMKQLFPMKKAVKSFLPI